MDVLKLAIDDEELGPRIRKTRIMTLQEVTAEKRLERLKKALEKAKALVGDDDQAKNLRARLEKAMDDVSELENLEEHWIDQDDRLRWGQWPDGPVYREIYEGQAICEFLIREYRPELRGYKIAVVFQEAVPPVNRRGRLGTAAKLPGKMRFLSQYDAVLTFGFEDWHCLPDRDRQRLVHHELEHLEVDDGLKLRAHDFEDFGLIVELYGLQSESGRFNTDGEAFHSLRRAVGSQLDLLKKAS